MHTHEHNMNRHMQDAPRLTSGSLPPPRQPARAGRESLLSRTSESGAKRAPMWGGQRHGPAAAI